MQTDQPKEKVRQPQNNLVLSLPGGDEGRRMKEALRDLASENHRSISNQVSLILRDFLRDKEML